MLNTKSILRLCEISAPTLQDWINAGIITPYVPGRAGRNGSRKFSLVQSIGLVIGARIYKSERGCKLSYVGAVVHSFEATTLDSLTRSVADGYTLFVCPGSKGPHVRHKSEVWDELYDIEEVYNLVTKAQYKEVK